MPRVRSRRSHKRSEYWQQDPWMPDDNPPNEKSHPTTIFVDRAFRFTFIMLIFSLGFMRPNFQVSGLVVQFTDLLFLASIALFAVSIAAGNRSFRYDRIFSVFGIYFLALAISAALSPEPLFSLAKLVGEAYLILLAVISFNFVRSLDDLKRISIIWIAASSAAASAAVLGVITFYVDRDNVVLAQFLHHYGSLPPGNYPRVQGTFIYPAMLCNYLTVGVLILLAAWKRGWIGGKAAVTSLSLHFIAAIFTITPGLGGLLFAVALWTSYFLAAQRPKGYARSLRFAGVAIAAASTVAALFTTRNIPTSPYRFDVIGTRIDPTQRLLTWQGAFETFLSNPMFGNGLGLGVANIIFLAPSGQLQRLNDAHNVFLNVAAQSGLFALAAVMVITGWLTYRSFWFEPSSNAISVFRISLGIAFVSTFIIQGMVGSFENARHLWVLMGIVLAATASIDEP